MNNIQEWFDDLPLSVQMDYGIKKFVEEYSKLQVENKRYKEALEEILITMPIACDGNPQGDYACDLHIEIAKEALDEVQTPVK